MNYIPKGIIKYQPCLHTPNRNVKHIINIMNTLDLYSYNSKKTHTPIIYYGKTDAINNCIAIENTMKNKFLDIPENHIYRNYWLKEYIENDFPDDAYLDSTYICKNNTIYKDILVTRIWYEKYKDNVKINVLMEIGNFSDVYLRKINQPHSFC